jgi:beta-glucosidase
MKQFSFIFSVVKQVRELKGFQKVTLKHDQIKTVFLDIVNEKLAFYDINMKHKVEQDDYEIVIGSSPRDQDLQKVLLVVEK